ncbi:MAG: hypothetical protein AAF944_03810 [Bacteroidota bacterium]
MSNSKEYVDPILIEEGFFSDEEEYEALMDDATERLAGKKRKRTASRSGKLTKRAKNISRKSQRVEKK